MPISMPVMMLDSGPDPIILLVLAVLLFGGSRLAGVGKGAGRALREFKEETASLHAEANSTTTPTPTTAPSAVHAGAAATAPEIVEGEVVSSVKAAGDTDAAQS